MKSFRHALFLSGFLLLILIMSACTNGVAPPTTPLTPGVPQASPTSSAPQKTPSPATGSGAVPCPEGTDALPWVSLVGTSNYELITCGHLKHDNTIQALVVVDDVAPGHTVVAYVYDNITDAINSGGNPKQIFKSANLVQGSAKIFTDNEVVVLTNYANPNADSNRGKDPAHQIVDTSEEFDWVPSNNEFESLGAMPLLPGQG